ncbi:MAG: hypothetical protein M3P39_08525 [Actinomycetota bacterium]|nr:hypothetical protein [Actinomycetota bacterium]
MREVLVVLTSAEIAAEPVVAALEEALPDGVGVTQAPGLLAPTPEGLPWREVARRRDAVALVLAAPGPDLANHALLTVEAARAAALAVGAVVVSGAPAPPDEQRLALEAHAGVDVVDVDPRDPAEVVRAVARWPLERWLSAPPAPPAGGALALEPYRAWQPPDRVPDPRTAGRPVLMQAVLDIVAAEGPVLASRAFALYNRAAGGKKLTSIARAPLGGAAYWLAMEGRIVLVRETDAPWQRDDVLRLPDQPAVRVRELGPRTLEEVPLDEVAELMRRLGEGTPADLKRGVLRAYGLVRLTARTDEGLELALGLLAREG